MICIIPARGGSKRLPGKNLRKLDGEYTINRVIKIANESQLFTSVIVSTDSEQIASIVHGGLVEMRAPKVSGDIPEDDVLKWTTSHNLKGVDFCRIYSFAVLLTPERLRAGFLEYKSDNYDAVLECQKYTHPVQRRFLLDSGYMDSALVSKPTELLLDIYHDAGTYMFTTREALNKPLAERNIKWLPVKEWEAQDIDYEDDWKMLEMKWEYVNK